MYLLTTQCVPYYLFRGYPLSVRPSLTRKVYHMVLDQWKELRLGTPAVGFYSLHLKVGGYAREEEIVVLMRGTEVDEYVRSNEETWIDEQSELSDMASWFLVALV